jgi:quercetin dioxygenase-like cupin family protein
VKKRHVIPVCVIALSAGMLSGSAAATPAEGEAVRVDLATGTTDAPISIVTSGGQTTFSVQGVVLKPGASTGWHTHPGPELTVVTKGTVYLQTATNCIATAFGAGRAIFIPAAIGHVAVNTGPDDAEVVVTYTLPAGGTVRDDVASACP